MIVLDTNVVSEAMKPAANPAVRAGLNEQVAETLYLTSVTLAELLFRIAALPASRRRNALSGALDGLRALFGDRVLSFDTDAARHYAELPSPHAKPAAGFPCRTDTSPQSLPRAASLSRHATRHRFGPAGSRS